MAPTTRGADLGCALRRVERSVATRSPVSEKLWLTAPLASSCSCSPLVRPQSTHLLGSYIFLVLVVVPGVGVDGLASGSDVGGGVPSGQGRHVGVTVVERRVHHDRAQDAL